MTARVLLNANGLRVSNPGYDVLSAAVQDLAFDSQYPMMGTFLTGTGFCNQLIMDPHVQSNNGTYLYFPSPIVGKIPITIIQWWSGLSGDPAPGEAGGGGWCARTLRYGANPPWMGGVGGGEEQEEAPGGGGGGTPGGRPEYDYPWDYQTSSTWGIDSRVYYDKIYVGNLNPYSICFRYVSFYTSGNY